MSDIRRGAKSVAKKSVKTIGEGIKATADYGTASVKAVGKIVSDAAVHAGSSSAAQGAAYTGKYVLHGVANALDAGIPIAGGFIGNKLFRVDDTHRLIKHSPLAQDEKLEEYNESYDLSKYKNLCKNAQKHLHDSASALLRQRDDRLDLSSDDSIRKVFEASKDNPDSARREASLANVNQAIGECIPKTKLTDLQQHAKRVMQGIEKGEDPTNPALADPGLQVFHRPQEVITALEELYKKAKEELDADQKQALAEIEKKFEPTPSGNPVSDFKKDLAVLLGVSDGDLNNPAVVDPLVTKHKAHFIKHVEDSYKKAEDTLKASFEDKTGQKDKDGKDLPDEHGLLTRAKQLKQACEYDLLKRVDEYERRKARGAVFGGLTASIGGTARTNPRCLKNRSLKEIKSMQVNGLLYGKTQLNDYRTASGTAIHVNENNGENTINVPGLAFPYHVATPERLQEDFEDVAERVLANKEKPEIEWKIEATTDDLRNKMIVAAYKASIAKGIDPKNIIMTVKGGGEKQNFSKKPIEEIIANSHPPIIMSQEDINHMDNLRKKQQADVKAKHEPTDNAFAGKYRNQLSGIKARGITKEDDELDLTPPTAAPPRGP